MSSTLEQVLRTRRQVIRLGVGGVVTAGLGVAFWRDLLPPGRDPNGRAIRPYGPRRAPDRNGIRLPEGFRSRVVARGGQPVEGTGYVWHEASDGMATFPVDGGGWILVSNSETKSGGASAIRFDRSGDVVDAYRILSGTRQNCSGGGTPWGTWLSCEEVEDGLVWECDPTGRRSAVSVPAMGVFKHEAAAVDPARRQIYMTEDIDDGGFYRFTPERWPSLKAGRLEIAVVGRDGDVSWARVPDPAATDVATRYQAPRSTAFRRGEGLWCDGRTVYVATTLDHRIHAYDTVDQRIEVIYDGVASGVGPLLRVDQLTATRAGEVFVCEDSETRELDIGVIDGAGGVWKFLSATGTEHWGSEPTGVVFTPDGGRMYFASQRAGGSPRTGPGPGAIYEITGPFRRSRGAA